MIWIVFNFGLFVGAIAFNMWSYRRLQKKHFTVLKNYSAFIDLIEKKAPDLLCEFRNTLNDEAATMEK